MSVPFPDPASDDDTQARLLAEADTRDNLSSRSPSGDGLSSRSPSGDGAPILSVSQLSAAIKRAVEDGFARVRVRGALSGASSEERRAGKEWVSTRRSRW